jgi:outer membrane protein assembly factor BamB
MKSWRNMNTKADIFIFILVSLIIVPFANANWSMMGHDSVHSGAGYGNPVLEPKQLWNYSTPNEPIEVSPVVVNGVVYIGLDDGPFGNWKSYVDAFNATTGAFIWRYEVAEISSSPAVADGTVFIGANYSMYALNASTGTPLWIFNSNRSFTDPTVANGIVYAGSSGGYYGIDNRFYALDAASGKQLWNCLLSDETNGAPAVFDNMVIFSVDGEDGAVYALNGATGAKIWSYPTSEGGSPSVSNGMLYLSEGWENFVALNVKNGAKVWEFNIADAAWSGSPAIANGVIYAGSNNGNLYALNASDGTKLWNFTTDSGWGISDSPAVAGSVVYFGTWDGMVYAVNATNGAELWKFATPIFGDNGSVISSSPAADNGEVYIASFYGCLYAFGNAIPLPATSQPTPSPSPSTVEVAKTNGTNISLSFRGNITYMQISNATLVIDQSSAETSINFTVAGQAGNWGFCNLTIPKNAVPFGVAPTIYIDRQKAENQGYSQDTDNYYVWFTTHFSTHQVSIVFAGTSKESTTTIGPLQITIIAGLLLFAAVIIGTFVRAIKKTQ